MRRKLSFPETGNILSEVLDVFYRGKHTGTDNQANVMTDYGIDRKNVSFAFLDEVVGKTIYNLTDGCEGIITSVTNNTITCSAGLSGGSGNDWDKDDEFVVGTRSLNVQIASFTAASLPPPDGYSTIGDGRKTVATAGTAEALVGSATPAKKVEIQALFSNTQRLAVGASTVDETAGSERGTILLPGSSFTLYLEDLADIFVDVNVNGEGVSYTFFE